MFFIEICKLFYTDIDTYKLQICFKNLKFMQLLNPKIFFICTRRSLKNKISFHEILTLFKTKKDHLSLVYIHTYRLH